MVLGRLAIEDIGGVGDIKGHFVPDNICGNEDRGLSAEDRGYQHRRGKGAEDRVFYLTSVG
jgi:hypothetical protein